MITTKVREKEKQLKTKSRLKTSRIEALLDVIRNDVSDLIVLKISLYRNTWLLEQVYLDECSREKSFLEKNPRFSSFIEERIPEFDLLDYYSYKPLIVSGFKHLPEKIENNALLTLRKGVVNLRTGALHEKHVEIIQALPHNKVCNVTDVVNALDRFGAYGKYKRSKSKITVNTRTRRALAKLSKNELIEEVLSIQRRLNYYKDKALKLSKAK
jgi:hypothetical protein